MENPFKSGLTEKGQRWKGGAVGALPAVRWLEEEGQGHGSGPGEKKKKDIGCTKSKKNILFSWF
jgi:hypothetical protein